MKEENDFLCTCSNDTEYLSRLESSSILSRSIKDNKVCISIKPVRLKSNGDIEYNAEYIPKHRNNQEED